MKRIGLCVLLMLSGCLVMSNKEEKMEGKYVAQSTFDQIEPGKTSAGWIKATLGDPSETTKDETSGAEIWKYKYTQKKESSGAIFLIFVGSNTKQTPGTAYVEIKDGVVKNKWRG